VDESRIGEAATLLRSARYLTAFTGAGISVESGIPPFRGPDGLWSRHDPHMLELSYFRSHPRECWGVLRELFYEHLAQARPNEAHRVLARWESRGLLKAVITQNIDSLHCLAGSRKVVEYHGRQRGPKAATPALLLRPGPEAGPGVLWRGYPVSGPKGG
jgi:NAD-dependent deacetylase